MQQVPYLRFRGVGNRGGEPLEPVRGWLIEADDGAFDLGMFGDGLRDAGRGDSPGLWREAALRFGNTSRSCAAGAAARALPLKRGSGCVPDA